MESMISRVSVSGLERNFPNPRPFPIPCQASQTLSPLRCRRLPVVACCALAVVLFLPDDAPAQRWGARPVAVKVAPVESASIPEEVSFIGTIEPNIATTVASVVSGRVAAGRRKLAKQALQATDP